MDLMPPTTTTHTLQFRGSGAEYFKVWIINIVLTLLTLGFYAPWAKVRNLRYFYANTQLDGSSFSFTADPKRILMGRFAAVIILMIYSFTQSFSWQAGVFGYLLLTALIPFALILGRGFRLRHSRYRNIHFALGNCVAEVYRFAWVPVLLLSVPGFFSLISGEPPQSETALYLSGAIGLLFLLLLPTFDGWLNRSLISHMHLGNRRFSHHSRPWDFYRVYLGAGLILALGIAAAAAVAMLQPEERWSEWLTLSFEKNTLPGPISNDADHSDTPTNAPTSAVAIVVMSLLFLSAYLLAFAYFFVHRFNVIYNHTDAPGIQLHSTLRTLPLLWLYLSNTLLILMSAGLATPWAKVRTLRYRLNALTLTLAPLDPLLTGADGETNVIAEELGDLLDIELGF